MEDESQVPDRRGLTAARAPTLHPTLVVLAAGLASRYGGLKQIDAMGPGGHALMDYSVYDAHLAGFDRVVFVIRPELEPAVRARIDRLRGHLRASYVFQSVDDSSARAKPWGTGHAVLAAEELVEGPFVVINADDYYGRSAYTALADHLAERPPGVPVFALVGFRLDQTLSEHGGVSRGECRHGDDGFLTSIREVLDVRHEDDRIVGTYVNGTPVGFTGAETVSMNIWGFTPEVFAMLRSRFAVFRRDQAGDDEAEFRIPDAVNDMVAAGQARVATVPAKEKFFGVTYPEDKALVRRHIRELVDAGQYPETLFTG